MLARYLRATLHIVLCSDDHLHSTDGPQATLAREEASRYIQALLKPISAPDVAIRTTLALHGSAPECATEVASAEDPVLVIKAVSHGAYGPDRCDWDLLRTCPVPVLLTRGRAWLPTARFAAALGPNDRLHGALVSVERTSVLLSEACGAELDFLSANEVLVPLIAQREYDLVAMRNQPYASREAFAAAPPARLLSCLGCDVLFVGTPKPSAATAATYQRRATRSSAC
jgi:hypothetical protein